MPTSCHQAREAFLAEMARQGVPADRIDLFDVPGAFEIPLHARRLALSGRYAAIVACALVVDGGIYRHEFVAHTVVSALMQQQLDTDVPMLSAVLTPHHFHEHMEHRKYFHAPLRDEGHRSRRRLHPDPGQPAPGRRNAGRRRAGRCRADPCLDYTLYGAPGSGAVPVHAALTLIGLPFTTVDVAPWRGEAERDKLQGVNPMRQVPALLTPDGELITESAAILIWLGDRHPEAGLCPRADDPKRAQYLRWMVYVPAAIYSMFWVRDDPGRLAADPAGEAVIKARTAERIAHCWRVMDAQLPGGTPYLMGDQIGMLDLYVAVVSRWTPRRLRFYREAPRMAEVVRRIDAEPRLAQVWATRFPFTPGWENAPAD